MRTMIAAASMERNFLLMAAWDPQCSTGFNTTMVISFIFLSLCSNLRFAIYTLGLKILNLAVDFTKLHHTCEAFPSCQWFPTCARVDACQTYVSLLYRSTFTPGFLACLS